jgi:hypothetical protein
MELTLWHLVNRLVRKSHKNTTKCNETQGKWCKNNHGASKIIDTFETYHIPHPMRSEDDPQSAEPCGEVQTISFKSFFSRNAPKLKVGRDMYKWICKDT